MGRARARAGACFVASLQPAVPILVGFLPVWYCTRSCLTKQLRAQRKRGNAGCCQDRPLAHWQLLETTRTLAAARGAGHARRRSD
jgi:hypothetical protein